jgi:hypothetical protein
MGDVLLLYTDGFVEHRSRGLDDGLNTVITAVDEAVRVAAQQRLGALPDRLRRPNRASWRVARPPARR